MKILDQDVLMELSLNLVLKKKGCTDSLYGVKSKCVLNIVPKSSKGKTLKIDKKCVLKRKK